MIQCGICMGNYKPNISTVEDVGKKVYLLQSIVLFKNCCLCTEREGAVLQCLRQL